MTAATSDTLSPSPESTSADAALPEGTAPAEPAGPGQAWALAEEAPRKDVIEVAGGSKEALAEQSETLGAFVKTLDEFAVTIGSLRISAFDALFVMAIILLVITAAWFATRVARKAMRNVSRFDGAQALLAEKILTIVIWTIAFFITVDLIGIDLSALAFFGGAFGLAVGFGMQKTFGNLISGILLLLDKSIKPGDVISVTDQAGNEAVGQIRKIGIRAISVITRDQTEHLIPNENLMVNQVVNWSYSSKDVRVKAPVGVSYDSDLKLVTELLYKAVDDTPRVLRNPKPRVNVMEFGDNSVNFEVRFWIQDPEGGLANIRSDVYMRIWELFQENDIEIPFPQSDLHLRKSDQLERLIELISAGKKTQVG
ncbi:MAG: mechanosensitive ion channel [Erythrobacter sp.]|uniref:mechanosensitive ion channel family protein n=1 Tax=Erythrobacter sp. TaxID=1042 RepID=UPI00262CF9F2|nr:mechanosensitive ion channel domain-containing protein [Erythrobacter sp.]MDJ0979934.1 mechanosensitive ion channel [Erythrobacter sp.]